MTDEEKAEEYVIKRPFIHLLGRNTFFIQKEFKDAILWALAEGRKEKCFEQNKDGTIRPCEVMKENEQLKEQNKTILEDNDTLNKWVDDLRKENENYKMAENESLEIIADLKAENEKLKICRNCNKEFTETCETCRRGLYDGEFDNWELAE